MTRLSNSISLLFLSHRTVLQISHDYARESRSGEKRREIKQAIQKNKWKNKEKKNKKKKKCSKHPSTHHTRKNISPKSTRNAKLPSSLIDQSTFRSFPSEVLSFLFHVQSNPYIISHTSRSDPQKHQDCVFRSQQTLGNLYSHGSRGGSRCRCHRRRRRLLDAAAAV
jgi:hypothetical protein